MFKPLLRTLPSLSGNFTIACKLREFNKESNNEYSTYVRLANLIPLQNFIANKNIELNLLNGKYEYDLIKYFYHYSNYFYKDNFSYDKNNYKMLNLDSLYNNANDTRNKDYEFGCKRIQYSHHGSQFNFYAPIYIDNVNDLPEYFCIHIIFNDHLEKNIKVYIDKDNKRNYLKNYLKRYLKQIDDRVIFCLPESLQATYFGIDVKNGGVVQYKDNAIGYIYNNQTTINNFDWTICQGFERNNLIMQQIIPLSFSFNLNDILTKYEQNSFSGEQIKISGFYYSKNDINYDLFDFDINYTNMYQKYNKYNENTGKYEFKVGNIYNTKNINIMNIGFPSLNEAKYTKYLYTNKITPKYCKFKMNLSSDSNPYIVNLSFGYSYNQYPNQKYGYFPTMFKGLYAEGVLVDGDLKLPIGNNLKEYYKTVKYSANKVYTNTVNSDKYIKLMSNYCSSWFNINNYDIDFDNPNFINRIFDNPNYWTNVKYNYAYFKGILYNLKGIEKYNPDNFGVFLDVNMKHYTQEEINDNFVNAKYVLSTSEKSTIKLFQFNDSYDMTITDDKTGICYYNRIFDVFNNSLIYDTDISTKYLCTDKNMILDNHGKFIEEKYYIEENTYYKLDDIKNKLIKLIYNEIYNKIIQKIEEFQIAGYLLLDAAHNINYFEEYIDYADKNNVKKRFIFANKDYQKNDKYKERFKWLYSDLYYSTISSTIKTQVGEHDSYDNFGHNESIYDKFCMFIKTQFIHKTDVINILLDFGYSNLLAYLNNLDSYIYEHTGVVNGIDINNYFVKNENLEYLDVYVDSYNLFEYIDLYNQDHSKKLSKTFNQTKEFYFKVINKDHILEYFDNLNKDECKNTTFEYSNNEFYNDILLKTYSNILDNLYVKERCWVIENNDMHIVDRYVSLYNYLKRYNEKLIVYMHSYYSNKDLINWLLNNISDTRSYNNNFLFTFKVENNNPRNNKDKFTDITIEMNLCFKKRMIRLNKALYTLLKNNHYLYLYIQSKENDNFNSWNILSYNDVNEVQSTYEYKDIYDYLIPLFNNPYVNDSDCKTVFSIINYKKINSEFKYTINNGKYFKEIDVDNTIQDIIINNDKLIYSIPSNINNIITINDIIEDATNLDLNLSSDILIRKINNYIDDIIYNDDLTSFKTELNTLYENQSHIDWNDKRNKFIKLITNIKFDIFDKIKKNFNNIFYINDNLKSIIKNLNKDEYDINWLIQNKEQIVEKLNTNLFYINWITEISGINKFNSSEHYDFTEKWNEYCLNNSIYIEDYIYENNEEDNEDITYTDMIKLVLSYLKTNYDEYYYSLINHRGLVLYSIVRNNEINLNNIIGNNLIYDSDNNVYLYEHNNKKYAFYWISLDIDNTNNSFYIKDDYNLNVVFDSINNISIYANDFNKYLSKVFYLLYPLLKFNIFNAYTKLNTNIVYPYESEILISYIQSLLNDNDHNKYSVLKDSADDLLYGNIVKIVDKKKIKLLRYFNYISPYLKKTRIINDSFSLRFMNIDNQFKNMKKYNIFDKEDLSIYKYNGINLYDGQYNKNVYQFTNHSLVNQYEYKHFEDNILFNLPETISINDRKYYTHEEISILEDNDKMIKDKKINILLKFFNKKGYDYKDIILFLFNKYDSNMFIERVNTKCSISEKIYKISYKFNLI